MSINKFGKLTETQLKAIEMLVTQDESGLTKEQIAKQLGVNPSTLWRWERNNTLFKDTLSKTAEEVQRQVLPNVYARLRGIISSPKTTDKDRLKAIELYLKNQGRLTTVQEVKQSYYNESERTVEELLKRLEHM